MEQTPDMKMIDVVGSVKSVTVKTFLCDEDFDHDKKADWEETYEFDDQGRFTLFRGIKLKYDESGNISNAYVKHNFDGSKTKYKVKRNENGYISKYYVPSEKEEGLTYTYKYTFYDNGNLKKVEQKMHGALEDSDVTFFNENGQMMRNEMSGAFSTDTYEVTQKDALGNWTEIHAVSVSSFAKQMSPDADVEDQVSYKVMTRTIKYNN